MKAFNKEVDYASLKRAASHYKGERGYCSVIAVAIVMGCKFGKAKSLMANVGQRKSGRGSSEYSINNVLKSCGVGVQPLPMGKGFMVSNSAKRLPRQGTFLVYSRDHITCLRDGIVQDWIVLPNTEDRRMTAVYQIIH